MYRAGGRHAVDLLIQIKSGLFFGEGCDDDHGFLRRVFEANLTVDRFAVEEFVHVEGQQTIIAMEFKADFVMTAAGFYIAARRRRWKIAFTER